MVSEVKALMQHTAWNFADIVYALGFEYPTYLTTSSKDKQNQPKGIAYAGGLKFLMINLFIITNRYINCRTLWYDIRPAQ